MLHLLLAASLLMQTRVCTTGIPERCSEPVTLDFGAYVVLPRPRIDTNGLYASALAAGDRTIPSSAYEVEQAQISQASAKDALWLGVTAAGDIYSGAIALHRCETCLEGNALVPSPEARIALKAGYTVAAWYGLRQLRRDDHPKLANTLRWVVVGLNLAFTASNTVHAIRGK